MTAPAIIDRDKIKRNVEKMAAQGAPREDIERYLQSTGLQPVQARENFADVRAGSSSTEDTGHAEGVTRSLAQGLTFGGSDELEGIGAAIVPGGEGYTEARDRSRARHKNYAQHHPYIAAGAEVAGSLPTAILAGPGGGIAGAAKGAAAFGALSGFGHAEGDIGKQATGTAVGGALGGALGAGMTAIGRPVKNFASSILTRANLRPQTSRFGITGKQEKAQQVVKKLFEADQIDEPAAQAAATYYNAGARAPEVLADLGGENVKRGLGALQAQAGTVAQQAKQVLGGRAKLQFNRIASNAQKLLGVTDDDAVRVGRELVEEKYGASKALYDKAYAHGLVDDKKINEMLNDPDLQPWFRAAFRRARRVANLEKNPLPKLYEKVRDEVKRDELGREYKVPIFEWVEKPDIRALDYVQRELRQLVSKRTAHTGKGGLTSTEGRAMKQRVNEFVDRLDELVPDFKAARQDFRTSSAAEDALQAGRNILSGAKRLHPDDVAEMSDAERELYLTGAVSAIKSRLRPASRQMLEGQPRDLTKLLNDDVLEQLQLAARTPEDFAELQRVLQSEVNMAETFAHTQGSRTIPTGQMQAALEGMTPDLIGAMTRFAGAPTQASSWGNLARAMFRNNDVQAPTNGIAEEVGRQLLAPALPQNISQAFAPAAPAAAPLVRRMGGQALGALAAPQLSPNAPMAKNEALMLRSQGLSDEALAAQLSQRYTPEVVKFVVAATPQRVAQ